MIIPSGLQKNCCQMAWLAVDKDGEEWIYVQKPERFDSCWDISSDDCHLLQDGVIKKLTGRKMTWDDEAVEI